MTSQEFLDRLEAEERCHRLVMQVVLTWDPPLHDDRANLGTCVQTAFMGGLAIAMGEDFPWDKLNDIQQYAVRQFILGIDDFLGKNDETH